MKKPNTDGKGPDPLFEFNLKMKLSLLLLIFALFQVNANSYGQNGKISLNLEKVPLIDVINEIEGTTEFRFLYNSTKTDINRIVSIRAKRKPIAAILKKLFDGTNTSYQVLNKQIVLTISEKSGKAENTEEDFRATNTYKQQWEVNGTVTDANGEPLPGASIVEKGTTNGTTTDFDGNFLLEVENQDAILVISYIGFSTQEIPINGQTNLSVTLQEDAAALEEVVVIGYGTQQLTKISGSVAKAPIGELQDFPVSNFDQALAGKLAGVQVLQTTGEPGRELSIKVRGTGTITAGAEPLYVVDGVPIESSGQATEVVNMEDIESIQILKDAASASIYGSRGGNGVVLISTKKGKHGKMKVNFNLSTGIQNVSKKIDMMDAYEYAQLSRDGHNAAYLQEVPTGSADDPNSIRPKGYHKIPEELFPYLNGETGLTNTDWQNEIYRSALIQKYNVSISGASDHINYFVSANRSDQEGIIINSDYNKTGLRANLGVTSGKFKIGLNLSPSYTFENRVSANNPYFNDGIVHTALAYSPTWPVYSPDGSFNLQGNGFWRVGTDYQHNEMVNPVALALVPKNEVEHYNLLGNLFLEYEVLQDLKLKSSIAFNYNQYQMNFIDQLHWKHVVETILDVYLIQLVN